MPPALGRPAAMMSPIYADVPAPQNQTSLMPSCAIQLLYASAEILARQKQADAQNKIAQAQAHYARLKARMAKTETFVIGGGEPDGMYRPKGPPLIATTGNS